MRIKKTDARWFSNEADPDKSRVKIKHLTPGELDEINDLSFVQDIEYADGSTAPVVKSITKSDIFRELPIQKAVVDWENFFDDDDVPMECTPENVLRAIRLISGFKEFVSERRKILAGDVADDQDEQLKN